jgi:hypothetical protein
MTAFLVFNELSAIQMAPSLIDAANLLEGLSDVLVDERIKAPKVLVTPAHFLHLQIYAGYSIGRWLAQRSTGDREKRLRVKLLVDRRSDYSDCAPLDELECGDVEYTCAGQNAQGLFVAFAVDGLAVSLWSSEQWNVDSINLEKYWIEADNLQTRTHNLPHVCRAVHLDAHVEWLAERQPPPPANGVELWNRKLTLFPSLDFCESVEGQIKILRGNEPRFKAVLRGLRDLQIYCDSWDTGNFDIHRLSNASGESQSTLNMFGPERTFQCPDGEYRLFDWHLKRGDTRIHFFDFPEAKRILVGYAGSHLRISSQ